MNKYPVILTMIVKNEEHIIHRSLDSTLPHVDGVVIIDTGSTDQTLSKIDELISKHDNIFYNVVSRDWIDFASNRNQSIELAEQMLNEHFPNQIGYIYVLDADDEFIATIEHPFSNLDGVHGYSLLYKHAGSLYRRTQMFPAFRGLKYFGKVHEDFIYNDLFNSSDFINLDTCYVDFKHMGARSKDPNTYLNDIKLLEEELNEKPNDNHPMYFLATAYHDTNQFFKSIEIWKRLIYSSNGWDTQRWYACIQIALMSEETNNMSEAIFYYIKAYEYDKSRAEPYYYLAKMFRKLDWFSSAYNFAKLAKDLGKHSHEFFLDMQVFDWKIDDELAVSAYYVGRYQESLDLCNKILDCQTLPDVEKTRIITNKNFAEKLLECATC